MLHLRARVPGQGHPDRGRPGERHPDALHRLRQLRHRVQPERQAGAQRHRGDRGAARRRRAGRGDRGAELPGRVHGVQHARAGRRPPRPRLRRRPRGQLRRRPRRRGVRAAAGRARRASHRHHVPGGRQLRAQVPPRHPRPPRAHRLAHAGDRARAAQEVRPGAQDRVHRALHRQEGRGALRAVRGRGPRGAHLRGAPRPPRRARRQPARAGGVPRGLRPAARQPRRPLPHHARHAPGGEPRRGPAERRHRERGRAPEPRRRDHRLRARPDRGATPRHPLLRGLHHGRRLQLRGAGLQAPLGRQRRDPRPPGRLRPGCLGGRGRRVRRRRPLAHLRAVRPALRRHAVAARSSGRSSRA